MFHAFSPILGGFRQGYDTQYVSLNFPQSCKNSIDNKGLAGAVFMDLSKASDCVNHGLLLAKLSAYALNSDALQLIRSYLTNRKQRVNISSSYSTWERIKMGVPRDSRACKSHKICTFACHSEIGIVILQLQNDCSVIVKWFSDNLLKLNDEKCNLMAFEDKNRNYNQNWKFRN